MLKLPKVCKSASKIVVGIALAMGVALVGVPGTDAQAASTQTAQITSQSDHGSLLLVPGGQAQRMIFDHESHSSHESHASHASHASHYSSQ